MTDVAGFFSAYSLRRLEAVEYGHEYIHDHHVGSAGFRQHGGLSAVTCFSHDFEIFLSAQEPLRLVRRIK